MAAVNFLVTQILHNIFLCSTEERNLEQHEHMLTEFLFFGDLSL